MTGRRPQWTLGDRLRKARHAADLDLQDIARLLGVHRNTAAAWEADDRRPSRGMILAWAQVCDVDPEWLAGQSTIIQPHLRFPHAS